MMKKKSIAIIGGGASALGLASFLDGEKYAVTIYERNKALGRKFLVAGKGGFNLTHSEGIGDMIERYTPVGFLDESLVAFDNNALCTWLSSIGIDTYKGTSRRIFPKKGIKPVEVLKTILENIKSKNHIIKYGMKWDGWSDHNALRFENEEIVIADYTIFCLGGASWKVTGSDGAWSNNFINKGIRVHSFHPANCAYGVDWQDEFIEECAGKPLKNISITVNGDTSIGEAMITSFGIEGNAVYAMTNNIQSQFNKSGRALIHIDLKPMLSEDEIVRRLKVSKRKITETLARDVKLEKVKIKLIKSAVDREIFTNIRALAQAIKTLPIVLVKAAPIDQAISTTGGVALQEINSHYELLKMPNTYVIGEMLDWNAPTGGYLLQACFSMGYYLAKYFNEKD